MKIVFMGTPHFALPTLQALIDSEHEIIAVYTKEPKKAGRGQQEVKSPIHQLAEKHGISILTQATLRTHDAAQALADIKPDIVVVVAYGLILPQSILDVPKFGCINLHPSKLPRWRGAAPLQHTILAGDTQTDICIIQMDKGMDTGDVILSEEFPIPDDMTTYQLHDEAAKIGARLMITALEQIETGTAIHIQQSDVGITHASKISRDDEKINWHKSSYLVNCQIRTFCPKPGAYFTYNGENIKVLKASYDDSYQHNIEAGTVIDDDLAIACDTGILRPELLQREGRKMIYRDAFLRGFSIPQGSKI
ncbi:MAG: methionyl-tRNA formyltransferase [Alphaproteobacteria bacterium]|jgi:methionyl-tRNA formyltransferase|nr:methionyl-tRNA formyltransferase [Candidatus Jidaibacter sp.]